MDFCRHWIQMNIFGSDRVFIVGERNSAESDLFLRVFSLWHSMNISSTTILLTGSAYGFSTWFNCIALSMGPVHYYIFCYQNQVTANYHGKGYNGVHKLNPNIRLKYIHPSMISINILSYHCCLYIISIINYWKLINSLFIYY